jgi:hypothetical protein
VPGARVTINVMHHCALSIRGGGGGGGGGGRGRSGRPGCRTTADLRSPGAGPGRRGRRWQPISPERARARAPVPLLPRSPARNYTINHPIRPPF